MAIPQLGTLFLSGVRSGVPTWTQPGGPGTMVFPQQQPGEQVAMFAYPYCGHWGNSIDLRFSAALSGPTLVPSAFMLCPLCSCVLKIFTPASLYLDNNSQYILIP